MCICISSSSLILNKEINEKILIYARHDLYYKARQDQKMEIAR